MQLTPFYPVKRYRKEAEIQYYLCIIIELDRSEIRRNTDGLYHVIVEDFLPLPRRVGNFGSVSFRPLSRPVVLNDIGLFR